MAKFSELPTITGAEVDLSVDLLCLSDISEGLSKSILITELSTILGGGPITGGQTVTVENSIASIVDEPSGNTYSWVVTVGPGVVVPLGPVSGDMVVTVDNSIASVTVEGITYSWVVFKTSP